MIRKFVLAAALLAPVSVVAQELPTAPYLPLDMAQTVAGAALDACAAQGYSVSVAIVARSGVTKVILRADNAGLRDMDSRRVIQAGGLPIRVGGALVGGVGVGGAPSGDIDATCARAGLDAIGAD